MIIDGITVNVISAPIIFILGVIFSKKILPAVHERFNPLAKYLASKNTGGRRNTCLIHGYARAKSQQKNIIFIEEGDLGALLASNKLLSGFDEKNITFKDGIVKTDCGTDYDTVICVSGPKWNKCTEYYIGAIGSPIKFIKTPKCVSVMTSKMETPTTYQTEFDPNGSIITCYGFVVYAEQQKNDDEKKNVLICCGRSTHSTNASLSILTQIKNRNGVYGELKSRGVFRSKGAWGILFKIKKEANADQSFEIDIIQVFLKEDFLNQYTYEYR